MADVQVGMKLEVAYGTRRVIDRTGEEKEVSVREEMQNDAAVWLMILDSVDVADKQHRDKRRSIRRLRRQLQPIAKFAEKVSGPGEHEVGSLEVSEEGLELMEQLAIKEPPEGLQLRGLALETVDDFEDLMDDRRAVEKAKDRGKGEEE